MNLFGTSSRKIMPLNRQATFFDAFHIAKKEGTGLPFNPTHDNYLLRSNDWKTIWRSYQRGMWSRQMVAGPGVGNVFMKGADIVDFESGARMPYDEAVAAAGGESFVGLQRVKLVITPDDLRMENGKETVHPLRIEVVKNAVELFGVAGPVDENTRLPLDNGLDTIEAQLGKGLDPLPANSLRWNYMPDFAHLRGIKRRIDDFRRGIFGIVWSQGDKHEVAIEVEG